MEPKNYAIVLYMNDEKTAMVKEWIKELAPVCGFIFDRVESNCK